jgi:hypothetical protein
MKTVGFNMLKVCLFALIGLATALLITQPVVAEETSSDSWKFSADIYSWMPSVKGERTNGKDLDVSFSEILDNLDFAYMGGMRATKDKLTFLVDVIYMDVEDTTNSTLFQGPLVDLSLTNVELKAWIVTPAVAYNVVQSDRLKLDLLVGAQYFYLKTITDFEDQGPLEVRKTSVSESAHYWNGIVGSLGQIDLNKNWYLPFSGYVGSGDTDLTWQLFGGVGYKFSKFDLIAGYRYLRWDFDKNDKGGEVLDDLYISGPLVGLRGHF